MIKRIPTILVPETYIWPLQLSSMPPSKSSIKIRQNFEALQRAARAQLSANLHSERVNKLSKEISVMQEAIKQVKFATRQVYQEQQNIAVVKDALQKSYERAKEEAKKKLISTGKAYDPEVKKYPEEKLMETKTEVEVLQEEMKKVHALQIDSVRVATTELNEAITTLQLVADECYPREFVSSVRLEMEKVKKRKQQNEMNDKEAEETQEKKNVTNEQDFRLHRLLSQIENATSEAEEMKKNKEALKIEAEAAQVAGKEVKQKLQLALEQAEEVRAVEKKALDEMQVLSSGIGKLKISTMEFESLKGKVGESGNMSEKKIAAAMAELEAINASRSEIDYKLEASLKAIEEIKAATELAEKSARMAEEAQSVIGGELRRRCQEEQMLPS